LNFDYTYVTLFGRPIFEPMVLVTNSVLLLVCVFCFKQLVKFKSAYSSQMAGFIIMIGISSFLAAIDHAAHYQLGKLFFDLVFFVSNLLNLIAIYLLFKASYNYYTFAYNNINKYVLILIPLWLIVLLFVVILNNNFLIIKIHAAFVLVYTLVVHLLVYRKNREIGSRFIVFGVSISFLSIIVHSVKFSFHAWFNYKDIAHVIMIIALIIIYIGIKKNSEAIVSEFSN